MRVHMSNFRWLSVLALIALCSGMAAASEGTSRLDQVLDRIVENERAMASRLSEYNPLVETYLQTVKPDTEMGFLPVKDRYFLGRLDLRDGGQAAATKVAALKTPKNKRRFQPILKLIPLR